MATILVVEDDTVACRILERVLTREGHEVQAVHSGEAAIEFAALAQPDLLVSDWLLNGLQEGIDVARNLRARWPGLGIIFMTGLPADLIEGDARRLAPCHVLTKPLDIEHFLNVVRKEIGHA